jgi:hypothetical protein
VISSLAVAVLALAGCQSTSGDPAKAGSATSAAPADNGVAALAADEILKRAEAAVVQGKSFSAKGELVQDGQASDVDFKFSGTDFIGSMSVKDAKIELLSVGGEKFIRPNAAFWTLTTGAQGSTMAALVGDRWVTGAGNDKSFAELFSMGSVSELLKPSGTLSKGEQKTIGGLPAVGLKDSGQPDSTLYVATTGEPYPLQLSGKGGATLVFAEFGTAFTDIVKPAAGQVLDLGKLTGK